MFWTSQLWTDGQTDGRTDRILITIPRLHYMQRGKNRPGLCSAQERHPLAALRASTPSLWAVPLSMVVTRLPRLHRIFGERELLFMFAICRRRSVCRLSVICNVRAPYSGDRNFRQRYAIWYLGNLWPFGKNFTEIVPGEPLRRGVKPKRGRKM